MAAAGAAAGVVAGGAVVWAVAGVVAGVGACCAAGAELKSAKASKVPWALEWLFSFILLIQRHLGIVMQFVK